MEGTPSGLTRCAVVTGGNKGIGLEICRQLASNNILVVLTSRDEKKGTEAVESLQKTGFSNVIYHQLDVTDPSSIASLASFIHGQFKKLDILVNNAADLGLIIDGDAFRAVNGFQGVNHEDPTTVKGILEQTLEKAEQCFKINYYGAKAITEALLPSLQLSNSANIVNVSSLGGLLRFIHNEKLRKELDSVESLTESRLDEILQWFLEDFKEDNLQANGWPLCVSAYKVSKAVLNAYTRMLARKYPNMRINCVHPGSVSTDMTSNTGLLTAEEGAKGPVMLAMLPHDGPSGQFIDEMNISTFE